MKPTPEDFAIAVAVMSRMIPFFPSDDLGRACIIADLTDMVGTKDELDWLVKTARNTLRKFEGMASLRGLFCSRFTPADGLVAASEIPGFRPRDQAERAERAYFEREAADNERRFLEYRKQAQISGQVAEPEEIIEPLGKPWPGDRPAREQIKRDEEDLARQVKTAPRRTPEENARLLAELEKSLKRG